MVVQATDLGSSCRRHSFCTHLRMCTASGVRGLPLPAASHNPKSDWQPDTTCQCLRAAASLWNSGGSSGVLIEYGASAAGMQSNRINA